MITKEIITLAVSTVMEVDPSEIMKDSKTKGAKENDTRLARQFCMAFARKYNLGTLASVAKYYGGRDHATCLHAEKIIDQEINIYPDKRAIYNMIELTIIEMSLKNIKQIFKQRMECEISLFIRRAKQISESLLNDISLKENELNNLINHENTN